VIKREDKVTFEVVVRPKPHSQSAVRTAKNVLCLISTRTTASNGVMAPPGYSFDMELLSNLFKASEIVKIKSNNERNKK
jgi:hypothetical protein